MYTELRPVGLLLVFMPSSDNHSDYFRVSDAISSSVISHTNTNLKNDEWVLTFQINRMFLYHNPMVHDDKDFVEYLSKLVLNNISRLQDLDLEKIELEFIRYGTDRSIDLNI